MPSKFIGTYDPKETTLVVGVLNISGFGDGTFITVARIDPEIYKNHIGGHGEMARTKNNNTAGTFTFSLKQTSPSNAKLDLLKNNPIVIPAVLRNNSDSRFIATMAEAWISSEPDNAFADEESMIEWVITGADLVKSHLG